MPPETDVTLLGLLGPILLRLALAVLLLLVGRWLAGVARRWTRSALQRARTPPSLTNSLARIVYYGTLLLAIFAALVALGVPVQVALVIIGAGLILAIVALRETLRDLAATVIIIVFQPFQVGDRIETNGVVGDVEEISMFSTVLITLAHQKVILPNGMIQNSQLINYTALEKTRLDLPVSIGYADDLARARSALLEIANADTRVLSEPAASVDVVELGENGVGLVLRVFTKPADMWALRPTLNERIKLEFDRRHLTIPFPQLQLHVEPTPQPLPASTTATTRPESAGRQSRRRVTPRRGPGHGPPRSAR